MGYVRICWIVFVPFVGVRWPSAGECTVIFDHANDP